MLRDSKHCERYCEGCCGRERGVSQGWHEVGSQVQPEEDFRRISGVDGCRGTWGLCGTQGISPVLMV
jgi:hypothetical protein